VLGRDEKNGVDFADALLERACNRGEVFVVVLAVERQIADGDFHKFEFFRSKIDQRFGKQAVDRRAGKTPYHIADFVLSHLFSLAPSVHVGRGGRPTAAPVLSSNDPHPRLSFAHAGSWFGRGMRADFLFNPAADVRVNALPVFESSFQNGTAYTSRQGPSHRFHEAVTLSVVKHFAHQSAGLGEIIVIRTKRIGVPNHAAVRIPAVVYRTGLIRPGTTL